MIIGYGSMAFLILLVAFITLSQIASMMEMGNVILVNQQPSQMHVKNMQSGVRHSNSIFQNYLLTGKEDLKKELQTVWTKEIELEEKQVDSLKNHWDNPENLILLEKLNRLGDRIQEAQKEAMGKAKFESESLRLSLYNYPNMEGDTIYDSADLQDWINDELSNQSSDGNPNKLLFDEKVEALTNEYEQNANLIATNFIKESTEMGLVVLAARDRFVLIESILIIVAIILCFILYRFVHKKVRSSINTLQEEVRTLSEGNILVSTARTNDEFDIILEEIHTLSSNLGNVKDFALEVGNGSFDSDISVFNNQGDIGTSLAEMRESLKNVSEEARLRNWANKGSAEFGDILRKYNNNISELCEHVTTFMVNYLNANQASFFIVEEDETGHETLVLTATYAYDRKKFIEKRIEPGQGLVGQVLLEKESIYLKELPANYTTITSGLGKATPKSIFIVPLIANEKVYGIIEIGTFTEFTENERKFIEDVGENIASSVQSVKINERTNKLLQESQEMTEEMRAQEEEMRQNMEEIQATQEEMDRTQKENSDRLSAMEQSGVAYIEFDPNGYILDADKPFLNLFGYSSIDEIKGQHHKIFVGEEYAKSKEYEAFRKSLRAGNIQSGVFERYSKHGTKLTIKGAYTFVKNQSGEITKVIKFASDISNIYEQLESILKEKETVIQELNELRAKFETVEAGESKESKAHQQALKESLIDKLQKNEEQLKASLEKQKRDLGIS